MNIFSILSLFGGLAMFLYGMRLMGNSLKEGSSGALRKYLGLLTNTPVRAFILGLLTTAVIQSSTATIVITSGLVGAGIISLHQSLGIVIGANVGTTVTGQIIRLLDIGDGGMSWLQLFRPSTLAPVTLIAGIILIMFLNFSNSERIGNILIGFGILFSGLLNMTEAVGVLSETGVFESIFSRLGENPFLGYLSGAAVAFILQSSSATIGILQAFSTSGALSFNEIYAVIVGIYLGDCVTTAIVCSIGAVPETKRVGIVNILFNLSETVVVLVAVTAAHHLGLLDGIWYKTVNSGIIANTNTIFNLGCAIVLFPMIGVYERMSRKIIKDEPEQPEDSRKKAQNPLYKRYSEMLNPVFYATPALAFNSCYEILLKMFSVARENLGSAFGMIGAYNEECFDTIEMQEAFLDEITDSTTQYLVSLSPHISSELHLGILNNYLQVVTEFERLGDHAENIAEMAQNMNANGVVFSDQAKQELDVLWDVIERILDYTDEAFRKRNVEAAKHIEPLEEVVDDMVSVLKEKHMDRLRRGLCTVNAGAAFLNLLSDIERISDICSDVGVEIVARSMPELNNQVHEYISLLHSGRDAAYNKEYSLAHKEYFDRLGNISQ